MAIRQRRSDITVEQWLKSEGILKEPPRPPRKRKQYKSIDGQQSLLEVDESGKPVVIKTTKKRSRRKA